MSKETIIKYLPNTTTKEEIKQIRLEYANKNQTLILIISGKEDLLCNLQSMLILTK